MEFRKWDVLSFLKCHTESWLSFRSTSLDIDPDIIYLCGYCLVFLFLCYLVGIPSLFTGWKTTDSRKCSAKRRRKGGTLTGWSYCQSDTEEKRKLTAIVKSPLGRQHDTTRFRQLLCPDPFCEVCNRTTTEINQLLFPEALEDAPSVSPLASTAPMTESSFTMSSAFPAAPPGDQIPVPLLLPSPPPLSTPLHSPNPLTCSDEFLAPSLGYNLSPEPFPSLGPEFPADHSSPYDRAFSPVPQYDTQRVDAVLPPHTPLSLNNIFSEDPTLCQDINALPNLPQPMNPDDSSACHHQAYAQPTLSVSPPRGSTLTVTQSKAISILFKSVPESSSSHSPPGLSVSAVRGIEHSILSVREYSWWQANATDWSPSTLAPRDFNQEFLALHSSETSFGGDPAANLVEPGNLSFLSPDVLELLERQVQKRSDFLMWKEKEKKTYSLPKPLRPGYQLNSSRKVLRSVADKDDSAVSLPFWSPKGKPQELQMHELPPHLKSLGDHLQQKRIQLFWGLPSLHSESLRSAIYVSRDSPSIFFFNTIPNASIDQKSPELPQPLPLSLPKSQPPSLPQTQSQFPSMPKVQPPADLPCPMPAQPSGPSHQIRICGVFFHRPLNVPDSLDSSDIEHLEWHLLQKQQENLWGLPAVVRKSHKDFCSSPPSFPQHRATRVLESISVLPGEFPFPDEIQGKLEHHLRKRLIQHRWGLPQRIIHSMSLLVPPEGLSETLELKSISAPSGSTVLQGLSSKALNVGQSQSGSVHEKKSSITFELEKDARKYRGHIPENDLKDDLLSSSYKHLGDDLENNLNGQVANLSGKYSRASEGSLHDNELENVLRVHLSKKFEEINEGRLPNTVRSSLHIDEHTVQHSVKPHNQVGQDDLSSSVPQDYSLNTSQQLSFIHSSAQQLLETHIKKFRLRMLWGLPSKVLESIEIFKCKGSASFLNHPSPNNMTTQEDSKYGRFKSIRRKSNGEENVGITGVGPVRAHPVPATSHLGRDREGSMREPIPAVTHEPAEGVQRMKGGRPSLLPVKHSLPGKSRQTQCLPGMRCPPMPPARQAVATHGPKAGRMSFSSRAEMLQGKERHRNLEMLSKANMSREIFRAEELDAPRSKSSDILITSKPGSPPTAHVNGSHVETTVTTERPPPQIADSQESKLSDLKKKFLGELKFLRGSRDPRDAPGQSHDIPLSLDNLTLKSSLTHAQGMSSGDVVASQVLQAHLVDNGISMGQQRVFEHVFRRCQYKNLPSAAKRVNLLGPNTEELGGGDARLGTSQPRRQSVPSRKMALEEAQWSKTSQMLSQKEQPPPENLFKNKMKHFLQWIRPVMTGKRQNSQRGSPISSLPCRHLLKSRTVFTGMTVAHKFRSDTGMFQEKLGYHEALHSSVTCGRTHQKAKVQTCTEPIQRHPLNCRGPSCKVTHDKSCSQAAVIAGQTRPASIRSERRMVEHRKLWHLGNSYCVRSIPQPHMVSVHHLNPNGTPHEGHGSPASLTTVEGTVFRDLSQLLK
ncbi:spermatogenesis-associated protein 31D3-like [Talpa occidentalis]|uniref:spermatogenesis-associated protein 31D3-like n=1 Tax=Talpa occidentalis TaxID=50954 RepID=UPI00188FCF11|nr:spermatogenesis-associated protein 31D3-like [Talpa occidentalis]